MLDAGPLNQTRMLEPFAMVWINQALLRGLGRNWAFGVIRSQHGRGRDIDGVRMPRRAD